MTFQPLEPTTPGQQPVPTETAPASNEPLARSAHDLRDDAGPAGWLRGVPPSVLACLGMASAAFVWTYWPTFLKLVNAWSVEPDYSHGYFIVPLSLYFLWFRRDSMPKPRYPGWGGLTLILAALAMHLFGSRYYLESLNGWSMILWLAGATWLLGGRALFRWSLPSVAFLVFMVPLPYRVESMFRLPLQRLATESSCWLLQSLGLPALAEGNVIAIADLRLEVAQACSGLRIFVSIMALASAYSIVARRPWQTKLLVFAGALPIAVLANATRVTLIGVLNHLASASAAERLTHDMAGLFVIVLAAALMACLVWYLSRLFIEVRPLTGSELLHAWDRPQSGQRASAARNRTSP
jgi:exosortase